MWKPFIHDREVFYRSIYFFSRWNYFQWHAILIDCFSGKRGSFYCHVYTVLQYTMFIDFTYFSCLFLLLWFYLFVWNFPKHQTLSLCVIHTVYWIRIFSMTAVLESQLSRLQWCHFPDEKVSTFFQRDFCLEEGKNHIFLRRDKYLGQL